MQSLDHLQIVISATTISPNLLRNDNLAIGLDVDWAYMVNSRKCDWADKHQSKEVFLYRASYSPGISV